MKVHNRPDRELIHGMMYLNFSDLPASRKAAGLRGHTSKLHMCADCEEPFYNLIYAKCYNCERERIRSFSTIIFLIT